MKVEITGEFIKLSQLLKKMNFIDSGGAAKEFLATNQVKINDNSEVTRGSKIKVGDIVWVNDELFHIVSA
ncbi:RNA-binding S4 domain-containing protein [Mycoplasma sp. 480]|uniref:RNA-binding S4 domain-containing protein n=1 Tax=Mycoplasma sp. 480 TaxID=3440155 RepID=UPI003F513709